VGSAHFPHESVRETRAKAGFAPSYFISPRKALRVASPYGGFNPASFATSTRVWE
tara:strand:+ start:342 stop:506 length:165 start_codon:yes stop_codon:yes gene_type:complete